MIDRRAFTALLAGAAIAPTTSWGQPVAGKTVFYASVGPDLTLYDMDVDTATLTRRSSVQLPANVQYAWPHPSRRYFYVASSNGGPGASGIVGDRHYANAFRIDPASGALTPHGPTVTLNSRPIHISVDNAGQYALSAYNDPSNVVVHRINGDGTLGDVVNQSARLNTGIFAHQIRTTPSNRTAILVTRGNNAAGGKPEDPGALKVFGFKDGVLTNMASIAPGTGLGFGPRHLDFHPTRPFVFVSIERQSQIYVYRLEPDGGLARDPLFVKTTLAGARDQQLPAGEGAGTIHIHPNGKFAYIPNRAAGTVKFEGKDVFAGGENNIAVFALNEETGEPTLIQNIHGRGIQLRPFAIDPRAPSGGGEHQPILVCQVIGVSTPSAGLSTYRIGADGKLGFVRKYDVDTGKATQFWSGMVTLA